MVTLGIISSGQIVEDMLIDVHIDETLPLIQLVVPRLKQNIEIQEEEEEVNCITDANCISWGKQFGLSVEHESNTAHVRYMPSPLIQGHLNQGGIHGQLSIKYDVDRKIHSSDVQVTVTVVTANSLLTILICDS